ncbi:MAG: hypothetical protein ACYCO5_16265, partial [Acidobacteriaceae bacterium]
MRFRPSIDFIVTASACMVLAPSFLLAHAQTTENPPQQESHGINVANMDRSVTPGDNFYLYANGDWIKRTAIPADRAAVGVFSTLDDTANKNTAALIQEAAKADAPAGSNARKIADLYNSYMNGAAIEAKGLTPLHPQLAAIAAIHTQRELA